MWTELSEIVRYHRRQSGLSQAELADLSGVGKTAIFDLEKGCGNTRMETLKKILKALNIEIQFFSPLMDEFKKLREKT
jgi:HTH-type transcriptional regulator / antitoxin HipB